MKKTYQKPTMKVFDIKSSQILCGSPNDPYNWPYPGAYAPGQPGLGSDDMNKLA